MKEICFNLWYYLSKDQAIIALSARHYILDGEDEDKSPILEALSYNDFLLVPRRPLPKVLIKDYGNYIHCSVLKERGIEEVYSEIFEEIRVAIPQDIPFPEDKLFFATPLYDFGNGFVPAEIGDGFIRSK